MKNSEIEIRELSQKMLRIVNKHIRLEMMPIPLPGVFLSHREFHAIHIIGKGNNINVTQIAKSFGVTKSAASQMIKKLAKNDFIIKEKSKHSNKELRLTLSKKGWNAFHAHAEFHQDHMDDVAEHLSEMTPAEMRSISKTLSLFEEVIDERLKRT